MFFIHKRAVAVREADNSPMGINVMGITVCDSGDVKDFHYERNTSFVTSLEKCD